MYQATVNERRLPKFTNTIQLFNTQCFLTICIYFMNYISLWKVILWTKELVGNTLYTNMRDTYFISGTMMLLMPPSLTLIFRHKLDMVWIEILFIFLVCTHWVATPNRVSPTRLTSAKENMELPIIVPQNSTSITIYGCFSRQYYHYQLNSGISVFDML